MEIFICYMNKKYNFSNEEINDMIKKYVDELKPISLIAKNYNVDPSVIKKRLKDSGIKIVKGSAFNIKFWLEKGLSLDEAKEKIKIIKPSLIEYWLHKGYSLEESKFQTELHLMNTERAYIHKYGEDEGKKLFFLKKEKEGKYHSPRRIEYWIKNGYSIEESRQKIKDNQNKFSLEKCIQNNGFDEGLNIFTRRQIKWQETLVKNGNLKKGFSKISQELFYILMEKYDINERRMINFATHNGEYKLKNPEGGVFIYDFTDLINNKIIEYHGDMYHANPKKYKKDDYPHPFRKTLNSQQIWNKDEKKIKEANNNNFDVLIIWDSEYRWGNKNKIVEKCLNFLNKK